MVTTCGSLSLDMGPNPETTSKDHVSSRLGLEIFSSLLFPSSSSFFLHSTDLSLSLIATILTINLLHHTQLAVDLPSPLAVELISLAARCRTGLSRRSPSICFACHRSLPIWFSSSSSSSTFAARRRTDLSRHSPSNWSLAATIFTIDLLRHT
ncbi:hypothetical protein LWI29_017311 [Acer saccharum]|uniref:Uncharacterized protein n=1 Tax=Acer saccharum TaxID=4024 RepID=A0AA39RLJ8_ACESA|nr:hypothetical protein LWI29_017311 [Acer saccharum]